MRLRPQDAAGNNALGAALVAAGHPEQGVGYLQAALKSRPDYFDAHYNLGIALAGAERFPGRRSKFEQALKLRPEDANVEANLGAALAEMGRFPEAKSHFEHALRMDPNQAIGKRKSRSGRERNAPALDSHCEFLHFSKARARGRRDDCLGRGFVL